MYEGVWTHGLLIVIYIGLFLLGTATSLEGQTTYTFTPYITSGFAAHSMLTTVSVVSSVLNTCLKAPVAKIAEVFGRLEALILCVFSYATGYIMISQSPNVSTYVAAQIFYVCGFTGTLMIVQLIVADTSSLVNRTLVSIMPGIPYLWTVWAGPALGQYLLHTVGWRWGTGMWAIIIPACASPVLVGLYIARARSKALAEEGAMRPINGHIGKGKPLRAMHLIDQMDLPGVASLMSGLSLLLVPLTLPRNSPTELWKSCSTWVCFVSGAILLCIWGWYDGFKAQYPLISVKSLKNRTIACLCASQFFDFAAFYIYDTMFVSYLQVARFATPESAGQIQNCFSFASTAAAVLAGFAIKYTRRYTVFVWTGAALNVCGILLMIPFRVPGSHMAWLIFAQCLIGFGSGVYGTPGMVTAQGWAKPGEVGAVTALYLTSGPLGSAFGTAIAGALWSTSLKGFLQKNLPASADQTAMAQDIAGSIVVAMSYPRGSEIRNAIIESYVDVMHRLCWVAGTVGVIFFLSTLLAQEPRPIDEANEEQLNRAEKWLGTRKGVEVNV
eukprot:Blabericola_migrator_1__651@NODE_1161_length_5239_cov_261_079660_g791_i0_p2_GENE_NODE_1161_length_5239_cov_261_079660_g791_i0NODE_1161_length_5239_cov_261_079660_g791_i0_p2_ORF_typecomplete_len555_score47_61TRI12/PF06609_13/3_9e70MFS_1/PF07690_16/2_5e15MFS_1/PF07690_16/4_3e16Sugar_tr/PF00083_24/0_00022Sugar_tr/PF00083_24/0_025OATP/PF03137_20/2_9e03OATP/PF03137_20/0_043OATP/PF03137_20/0_024MFS_3/PF05977_13/2_9e02MFS_3/PF05977_13/0_018_NODE_1161_length_5239_cov_261_079660_g791_i09682632